MEADILNASSPLGRAVAAFVPLRRGAAVTLVHPPVKRGAGAGFVQGRRRRDPLEADVLFAAPLPDANGAALVWQRMLSAATQALGEQGAVRVYAVAGDSDQLILQVFRQVGFQVYANDTVFHKVLESSEPRSADTPPNVVPQTPQHIGEITRLYHTALPESALAHESPDGTSWRNYPAGGWCTSRSEQVFLDERGAVSGAWRLIDGRRGAWLQVVADPAAAREVLAAALQDRRLTSGPGGIYCAARGHEAQLNLALRERGFAPVAGRFRLVKHTAARILEPTWQTDALAERRLDPATTHSALAEAVRRDR
jgi:hypothetical protein